MSAAGYPAPLRACRGWAHRQRFRDRSDARGDAELNRVPVGGIALRVASEALHEERLLELQRVLLRLGRLGGASASARAAVDGDVDPAFGRRALRGAQYHQVVALRKALGVPRRAVTVLRGDTSRQKTIRIAGLTLDQLKARLTL